MTDPAAFWPASAFAQYGLESDQLRMASDRGDLACQRPHTEANPTGRRRYLVRDVEARWPECFPGKRTNPNEVELSTDSGKNVLTLDGSGGKIEPMTATPTYTTLTKAAHLLGVSGTYLKQQINARNIPHLRMGRSVRVDPRAVKSALSRLACETLIGAKPQE